MFGEAYARAYDVLYQDKDYEHECDLFEECFSRFGDGPIRTVLDLGCGTGGHAIPLARRGYEVVGVDRSCDMLDQARGKAKDAGLAVTFREGDARTVDIGRNFEVVVVMFAVIGYQLTNADVRALLATVRRHLHPGG